MTETPYHVRLLHEQLLVRQRRSSLYSLRAFARDLGINHATLSLILNGKRDFPRAASRMVADNLKLSPVERTKFVESILGQKCLIDQIPLMEYERLILDESNYKVIVEWEHFGALTLFELKDFVPREEVIAARLGLSLERTREVLENLLKCGLLVRQEGNPELFAKANASRVSTTEDVKSLTIQDAHVEAMEVGIRKVSEVDVNLRDFTTVTFPMDTKKMDEAKAIIREFKKKMCSLAADGDPKDVYQMAIQLYPLTDVSEESHVKH